MRAFLPIIISLCVLHCFTINQTCAINSDCPANSQCSSGYCKCNVPYILDCSVPADALSETFGSFLVTNVTSYYQTQGLSPNIYYSFLFQVCCASTNLTNYDLNFTLWVNDGENTLNQDNFVGTISIALSKLVEAAQCIDFVQYQIKLEPQPNGQTENLIVGLVLQPQAQSDYVDGAVATIQMNVTTKQIISSQLLIKLAIGIICFAVAVIILIIVIFCYKRYKLRQAEQQKMTYKQKMLDQFKKITPECQAKTLTIHTMQTCSICLGQFQPDNKVRRIICGHIFHTQCIDGWCMKNLTCPECRLQLDSQSIKKKKRQVEMTSYKWRDNPMSERQELNQSLNK